MAEYITAFIDGAARFQGDERPNESASAVVIYRNRKETVRFVRGCGNVSNNAAEYMALIDCLLICSMSSYPSPIIYTDSKLVFNQTTGLWACRDEDLLPLYMTVQHIQKEYNFTIIHVPRSKTFVPDGLWNLFLDDLANAKAGLKKRNRNVKDDSNVR